MKKIIISIMLLGASHLSAADLNDSVLSTDSAPNTATHFQCEIALPILSDYDHPLSDLSYLKDLKDQLAALPNLENLEISNTSPSPLYIWPKGATVILEKIVSYLVENRRPAIQIIMLDHIRHTWKCKANETPRVWSYE